MDRDIVLQIGIDWADKKHDFSFYPPTGRREHGKFENTPKGIHDWIRALHKRFPTCRFEICVELSRGGLINAMRDYDFIDIYPLHTTASKRLRQAFNPSGRKSDLLDADIIGSALEKHKDCLHLLSLPPAEIRELDELNQMRRQKVEKAVKAGQQLLAVLKECYPQALDMFDDIKAPSALAFLKIYPCWAAFSKATDGQLRKFFHEHNLRDETTNEEKLMLKKSSEALTTDDVVKRVGVYDIEMLVEEIEFHQAHVKKLDAHIAAIYQRQASHPVLSSLPGAGKSLGPRLLVALYKDEILDASIIGNRSGITPIIIQSGKMYVTKARQFKPQFTHQSMVEYADCSRRHCAWAWEFYQTKKEQGDSHGTALRKLAVKWTRIICECLKTNTPYDDAKYMETLNRRKSPYANIRPKKEKFEAGNN